MTIGELVTAVSNQPGAAVAMLIQPAIQEVVEKGGLRYEDRITPDIMWQIN